MRTQLEELLQAADPARELYPGWTVKDLLAHITGWDDATITSLRSHVAGRTPVVLAERGIDEYNARTVTSRRDLDYPHVLKEWRLTRQVLRTIIEQMPDEKFLEPLVIPWGGKGTVTFLVETFRDHEDEHVHDLQEWLKDPSRPLGKDGD
jgi:uncharacterized protein (TIGR03083 family)